MKATSTTYTVTLPEGVFKLVQDELAVALGITIKVPDVPLLEWLLKVAPRLDKELCRVLNGGMIATELPDTVEPLHGVLAAIRAKSLTDQARLIRLVRVGLLVAYKTDLPHTKSQEDAAILSFLRNDEACDEANSALDGRWTDRWLNHETLEQVAPMGPSNSGTRDELIAAAARLISRLVAVTRCQPHYPKHGPGAVYPPRSRSAKGRWDPQRVLHIEDEIGAFPKFDVAQAIQDGMQTEEFTEALRGERTLSERLVYSLEVAKVTCVPKDARGPRIICIHSAEAVWMQQAHRYALERAIRCVKPFAEMIDLTNQSYSQEAAMYGSKTGQLATLDLKDASDRICTRLVTQLFGPEYLADVRSCCAARVVIGDTTKPMVKFAPMGNALTFPVQSVIYAALAYVVTTRHPDYEPSTWRLPRVFGDDIVVDGRVARKLCWLLGEVGLVVNNEKSFLEGWFREACGFDGWGGQDVTPIRLRTCAVDSIRRLDKALAYCKQLRLAGYKRLSRTVAALVHDRFCLAIDNSEGLQKAVYKLRFAFDKKSAQRALFASWWRRSSTTKEAIAKLLFVRVNNPDCAGLCVLEPDEPSECVWNEKLQRYEWPVIQLVEHMPRRGADLPHHLEEWFWEKLRSESDVETDHVEDLFKVPVRVKPVLARIQVIVPEMSWLRPQGRNWELTAIRSS